MIKDEKTHTYAHKKVTRMQLKKKKIPLSIYKKNMFFHSFSWLPLLLLHASKGCHPIYQLILKLNRVLNGIDSLHD